MLSSSSNPAWKMFECLSLCLAKCFRVDLFFCFSWSSSAVRWLAGFLREARVSIILVTHWQNQTKWITFCLRTLNRAKCLLFYWSDFIFIFDLPKSILNFLLCTIFSCAIHWTPAVWLPGYMLCSLAGLEKKDEIWPRLDGYFSYRGGHGVIFFNLLGKTGALKDSANPSPCLPYRSYPVCFMVGLGLSKGHLF